MALNLLRPEQRSELQSYKETLKTKLANPHIEDKGAVARQLKSIEHQLNTQTPRPYAPSEIDQAVKQADSLKEEILAGMPSQEEMRKNPPGAVGKHMAWEKRNKKKLLQWKEIQLRLNHDNNDPDIANFERFRPKTSSLNMDNAQISGTSHFLPPTSPEYQEGYERIFGKKKDKPEKKQKRKHNLSEAQREALRIRMKDLHAKRRAKTTEPPQEQ